MLLVPSPDRPELLDLPWELPLAEWDHPRLVRMVHGESRHVVRFLGDGERVYALKEMAAADADREYALLRLLGAEGLPAVEAAGLVSGRHTHDGRPLETVLVTRHLDYSLPFRYLFRTHGGHGLGRQLVDAAVVLLVRIHLEGFYWGDCSLSNLLFRRDAGHLVAYLVDAETAEHHQPLPGGMRLADLALAKENLAGGLLDLQASDDLASDVDVVELVELLEEHYGLLWDELTAVEEVDVSHRHVIDRRIRRLNDLGFDVGELVVEQDSAGERLKIRPALVEEGHHCRELRRLTGLEVQENQARRLLNDIAAYGAHLERSEGRPVPQAVVAARWIAEVYEPLVAQVPEELSRRLESPELFHELLEHRYYLSEAAGHEVDNVSALRSYLESVLRFRPDTKIILAEE